MKKTVDAVVRLGHPALRQKSEPVDPRGMRDPEFQKLIDRMIATMRSYDGVGIAAPQIGVPLRIFCVECRNHRRYADIPEIPLYTVVNPVVTVTDSKPVGMHEGCLSIPELRGHVDRANGVRIRGLDRHGNPIDMEVEGFHARIIQHEFDHINGKVYLDRVSDKNSLCYLEYME